MEVLVKGSVGEASKLVLEGNTENISNTFPKYDSTDTELITNFDSATLSKHKQEVPVLDINKLNSYSTTVIKDNPTVIPELDCCCDNQGTGTVITGSSNLKVFVNNEKSINDFIKYEYDKNSGQWTTHYLELAGVKTLNIEDEKGKVTHDFLIPKKVSEFSLPPFSTRVISKDELNNPKLENFMIFTGNDFNFGDNHLLTVASKFQLQWDSIKTDAASVNWEHIAASIAANRHLDVVYYHPEKIQIIIFKPLSNSNSHTFPVYGVGSLQFRINTPNIVVRNGELPIDYSIVSLSTHLNLNIDLNDNIHTLERTPIDVDEYKQYFSHPTITDMYSLKEGDKLLTGDITTFWDGFVKVTSQGI